MTRQTLTIVLVILGVVVLLPLLGMIGMGVCCGGMMGGMRMDGMMDGMMGMGGIGLLWMLLGAVIVVALIVVLVRGVSRT